MSSGTNDYYEAIDGSRSAEALVTSILINGRGQYFDPRNNDSSSTPFERLIIYETGTQYRIRLINGGSAFSLVFSIDEHPLQVISSDGVPFAEPVLVDQLIIGLGERYDVLVNITSASSHTACKLCIRLLLFSLTNVSMQSFFSIQVAWLLLPAQMCNQYFTKKIICMHCCSSHSHVKIFSIVSYF